MFNKTAVALVFVLLLAGCSKNYMAERKFYEAKQVLASADKKDPAALDKAIRAFEDVADQYPGTAKALESLQIISNIYMRQKKFAEAREAMTKLMENSSSSKDSAADARYSIGQIYEVEGNWKSAEQTYWDLAEYSPLSMKGLYAPIRIISHYKQLKQSRELKETFVKALDHYDGLIKQVGEIDAVAPVKNYQALAYLVNGDADRAITIWLGIADEFPKSPFAPMGLLASAEQEWNRKNQDKAVELYNKYFALYPSHFLAAQTAVGVGMRYHQDKDFVKAREWYSKALEQYYKKDSAKQADIKLLIGKTFQDEDKWPEADVQYTEIETQYGNTTAALQVPLIRANYFQMQGDKKKSDAILDEALQKYDQLQGDGTDQKLNQFTERVRAQALAQKGDWDKVVEEVDKHMQEETVDSKKGRWLFLKALLIQNRLNKPDVAASLFKEFLQKYPNDPLAPKAKSLLENLSNATPAS